MRIPWYKGPVQDSTLAPSRGFNKNPLLLHLCSFSCASCYPSCSDILLLLPLSLSSQPFRCRRCSAILFLYPHTSCECRTRTVGGSKEPVEIDKISGTLRKIGIVQSLATLSLYHGGPDPAERAQGRAFRFQKNKNQPPCIIMDWRIELQVQMEQLKCVAGKECSAW